MGVINKKRKHGANADPVDIISTVKDFGQKYHCDGCSKDITHLVIIRCAVCTDFDLCLSCFCAGFEIADELKDHKKDHAYRIIDILDFPIFEKEWGADEEILLVEGLEQSGLAYLRDVSYLSFKVPRSLTLKGNWETISEHIGTKNQQQVARHYQKVFLDSPSFPVPDFEKYQFDMSPGKRIKTRPAGYTVPKLPKPERTPASQPVNHDIAGYMPGRGEFETEFDNDADNTVKEMEFLPDDSSDDTELKCAIMNIYNTALDRRVSRKEFIFERELTDYKKIQAVEKKRPKEEKELYQRWRVFARMQTDDDFKLLMDGLIKEMKLRSDIALHQEYLRMGLKTRKDAAEYEKFKVQRLSKGLDMTKLQKKFAKDDVTSATNSPLRIPLSTVTSVSYSGGYSLTPTRKASDQLDTSSLECVELLSEDEKQICSNLRIFPRAYLTLKDTVLKEYAQKGVLKRRNFKSLVKIESSKGLKLLDFFVGMGWITSSK